MGEVGGVAQLGPVGELDLRPVFQPIVDLRDGDVVGYEALTRVESAGGEARSAGELFAAARRERSVRALDLAARAASLRAAQDAGIDAPFSLFLNADAETLSGDMPERPDTGATVFVEVTERALIERPEALLRALTELRTLGWGIALDDVGADSRSLALMSVLYPDLIKLDLALLARRSAADRARIVTAVGAEAERRRATVLAEGIDSEAQLAAARACGAALGQGYFLGAPAPLPSPLPDAGRGLRLAAAAGDPFGPTPWQRVTNWRRPVVGSGDLAAEALQPVVQQAAANGSTAMLLASLVDESFGARAAARFGPLAEQLAFVGILNGGSALEGTGVRGGALAADDPLRETGTVVTLAPDFAACFVVRAMDGERWAFAVTYDRETVVECALPLIARMEPLA